MVEEASTNNFCLIEEPSIAGPSGSQTFCWGPVFARLRRQSEEAEALGSIGTSENPITIEEGDDRRVQLVAENAPPSEPDSSPQAGPPGRIPVIVISDLTTSPHSAHLPQSVSIETDAVPNQVLSGLDANPGPTPPVRLVLASRSTLGSALGEATLSESLLRVPLRELHPSLKALSQTSPAQLPAPRGTLNERISSRVKLTQTTIPTFQDSAAEEVHLRVVFVIRPDSLPTRSRSVRQTASRRYLLERASKSSPVLGRQTDGSWLSAERGDKHPTSNHLLRHPDASKKEKSKGPRWHPAKSAKMSKSHPKRGDEPRFLSSAVSKEHPV